MARVENEFLEGIKTLSRMFFSLESATKQNMEATVSWITGASAAPTKRPLALRSRGQAPHPTPRARARFQACAAAGLAARPCHRGEKVGALQCGRAPAFSLYCWQTGLRRLVSELRVPLPDGALHAKKWTVGRGADYAVWRASQQAVAWWAGRGVFVCGASRNLPAVTRTRLE